MNLKIKFVSLENSKNRHYSNIQNERSGRLKIREF